MIYFHKKIITIIPDKTLYSPNISLLHASLDYYIEIIMFSSRTIPHWTPHAFMDIF